MTYSFVNPEVLIRSYVLKLMTFHFYSKFQHRRSSFKELQYICNGDSNGVLYFAGTSYGEHQWVNPVLSKVNLLTAIFSLDLVPWWDMYSFISCLVIICFRK